MFDDNAEHSRRETYPYANPNPKTRRRGHMAYDVPMKTKPRIGIGLSAAEHNTHDTKYEARSR